ncbi:MAG: bifunctional serine/threonine-protein kinase/formylglycine-generating enzyme family protein [Polyangiaceae bacterium]
MPGTPFKPSDPELTFTGATIGEGATVEGDSAQGQSAPTPPSTLRVTRRHGLPERYEYVGPLSGGASAEVLRVRDKVLDRVLAMKLMRWEHVDTPRVRSRFLAEAQVTAGLQHPGIVAVHDRGELTDRRLWFTMKEVRGRTLGRVIDEVHAGVDRGSTFRRLVDAFARVAQAVGYAHSRGIVHRDLKPDNIMVGEFGEVLVMDWGLARRVDVAEEPHERVTMQESVAAQERVTVHVSPSMPAPGMTRHGDVLGTPAYMPPEQARGEIARHAPPSDVYGLGAILYHVLVGRPPYEGDGQAIWYKVVEGPAPNIREDVRGRSAPPELIAIAERAMAREMRDRYADANALAADVLSWLDGAKRREAALVELSRARQAEPKIAELRARAAQAEADARAVLEPLRPSDPVERKRPAWQLEKLASELRREAALREADWLRTVHGALSQAPDLPEAHDALAEHYRRLLTAAEDDHRDEDAARFEVLFAAHARGRSEAFLRGDAAVTLITDPPGAEVIASRYETDDHRLVPDVPVLLGTTPLFEARLQRGSYLLTIRAPGGGEVRYPIHLARGGHWDGCAPGRTTPTAISLREAARLGPEDVYVPAGVCWVGGDPEALDSLPRKQVWVDAFVVRRFPVTFAEYIEFLNDLVTRGREAEALAACPAQPQGGGFRPEIVRDARGHFSLTANGAWGPDHAAVLIDWHAASAYAAWLAARTGKPWRLLNDLEREKAARGVDGRKLPWGEKPEATYGCAAESFEGDPGPVPVHAYPLDESPYGVRGLAGQVRDWCINLWHPDGSPLVEGRVQIDPAAAEDPAFRVVRGGAWASPLSYSRAATRFASRPTYRHLTTGFRLARSCEKG